MNIEQTVWTGAAGWQPEPPGKLRPSPQVVLLFGAPALLRDPHHLAAVRGAYPEAHLVTATTAGEIAGEAVLDDSLVCTAVHFVTTRVAAVAVRLDPAGGSPEAGPRLAAALAAPDLAHVWVCAAGARVDGSALVEGLVAHLPAGTHLSGGFAGDGLAFHAPGVGLGEPPQSDRLVALGFYGPRLVTGQGLGAGWQPVGPERRITRARGPLVREIDGEPALALYRRYLGDDGPALPAGGQALPLAVLGPEAAGGAIRTILGVDERTGGIIFSATIPEGTTARLVLATDTGLIAAAQAAARAALVPGPTPALALLCGGAGRKQALGPRADDEPAAVQEVLGRGTVLAGFYGYGQIGTFTAGAAPTFQNQMLSITTFREV